MSHVPHELGEEFPEHAQTMHRLKIEDAHFANLAEKYHEINRAVHRAETDIEPTSDAHMTEMRKTRAHLKDEIAALLSKHG